MMMMIKMKMKMMLACQCLIESRSIAMNKNRFFIKDIIEALQFSIGNLYC